MNNRESENRKFKIMENDFMIKIDALEDQNHHLMTENDSLRKKVTKAKNEINTLRGELGEPQLKNDSIHTPAQNQKSKPVRSRSRMANSALRTYHTESKD